MSATTTIHAEFGCHRADSRVGTSDAALTRRANPYSPSPILTFLEFSLPTEH
jgi:hypothetical protein